MNRRTFLAIAAGAVASFATRRALGRVVPRSAVMPPGPPAADLVGACSSCLGNGWVCECHPDRPFDTGTAADCQCGGAGMPCGCPLGYGKPRPLNPRIAIVTFGGVGQPRDVGFLIPQDVVQ